MKIPIPNDWDGKEWECFSLQWPKSDQMRVIIVSLLYSLSRGRSWDESTGEISYAQGVAREIFDANNPLVRCYSGGSVPDNTDEIPAVLDYRYLFDCDDDDCSQCERQENMSGCCVQDVKIENGILYVMRCGQWENKGELAGVIPPNDELPDGEPIWYDEPDEGETEVHFACQKATAFWSMMFAAAEKLEDIWDDPDKWNYIKKMEDTIGYNCDNVFLLGALATRVEGQVIGFSVVVQRFYHLYLSAMRFYFVFLPRLEYIRRGGNHSYNVYRYVNARAV